VNGLIAKFCSRVVQQADAETTGGTHALQELNYLFSARDVDALAVEHTTEGVVRDDEPRALPFRIRPGKTVDAQQGLDVLRYLT
jgi:hypothetical protein